MIFLAFAIGLTVAFLLLHFWPRIILFLRGPFLDFMANVMGVSSIQWYLKFLGWLDKTVCFTLRAVEKGWQMFKETVLLLKATYRRQKDGCYYKTLVSVVRLNEAQAKRLVREEIVPCNELPKEVQEAMRQNNDEAELDMRNLVREKTLDRCREEDFPKEELVLLS